MNHTMRSDDTKDHDGLKVKRIREMLKVKQSTLAHALGEDWNQKKISQLEDKEVIDDKLMEEIAGALKVPVEVIRNFDDEKAIYNISCSFSDNAVNNNAINVQHINPVEKWMEAIEENKKLVEKTEQLYERLLQAEKEKNEMLQRMLDERK